MRPCTARARVIPIYVFQVWHELNAVKEGNAHFGELYIFEKHLCFDLKALSPLAPGHAPPLSPRHRRRSLRRASRPAGVCLPQAVGT